MAGSRILKRKLKELGLTQAESQAVVAALVDAMAEALGRGESVAISGFGRFEIRKRQPRTIRLPWQDATRIPARRTVRFKSSPKIFQRVGRSCR